MKCLNYIIIFIIRSFTYENLFPLLHHDVKHQSMLTYDKKKQVCWYTLNKLEVSFKQAKSMLHTVVYLVISQICPKILCMHKTYIVCRHIAYTLDTLCVCCRALHGGFTVRFLLLLFSVVCTVESLFLFYLLFIS